MEGNKREMKEFSKEVGLFEASVISVNPDKQELEQVLQTDLEKEPVYVNKKEGVDTVRISVWLKDVNTEEGENKVYNCSFFMQDEVRENKDKTKVQYVNSVGQFTWGMIDSKGSDLAQWFTHFVDNRTGTVGESKTFRTALVGEEELMTFIKNWLTYDLYHADTNILLDTKKLFRGNVKELTDQIGGEYSQNVLAMATVRSVTKESESGEPVTNNYQSIYNKAFLPGHNFKFFKGTEFDNSKITRIKEKSSKKLENFERFILAVTDSQYGCKDSYFIGIKKEFNADEYVNATDAVLDSSGSDY